MNPVPHGTGNGYAALRAIQERNIKSHERGLVILTRKHDTLFSGAFARFELSDVHYWPGFSRASNFSKAASMIFSPG